MEIRGARQAIKHRQARLRAACALVALLTACSHAATPTSPAACDDAVRPQTDIPPAMAQAGFARAVGSGDTWFIAPSGREWSSSVVLDPQGGYSLKIGIWTSMDHAPAITVHQVDGPGIGTATTVPTSNGLPGPLPSNARFKTAGCWDVTAQGATGRATARVRVG
jgi:hypothetical protein